MRSDFSSNCPHLKRFGSFHPVWGGCSEGLDTFRFFFKLLGVAQRLESNQIFPQKQLLLFPFSVLKRRERVGPLESGSSSGSRGPLSTRFERGAKSHWTALWEILPLKATSSGFFVFLHLHRVISSLAQGWSGKLLDIELRIPSHVKILMNRNQNRPAIAT